MAEDDKITAVVLAGGRGSRLRPLTDDLPKPLVPVGGEPILGRLLRQMARTGVMRVHLAVNHMADQIESTIGDGRLYGLECRYSREDKPLSTIAPLKLILDLPENFLVVNGDLLTDLDFGRLYEAHLGNAARLTVAVKERQNRVDFGVLELDDQGLVRDFTEKPSYQLTVSMGAYTMSRALLSTIPDGQPYGFDDLVADMLGRQEAIATVTHTGYWLDIGRAEDYLQAQKDLSQQDGE